MTSKTKSSALRSINVNVLVVNRISPSGGSRIPRVGGSKKKRKINIRRYGELPFLLAVFVMRSQFAVLKAFFRCRRIISMNSFIVSLFLFFFRASSKILLRIAFPFLVFDAWHIEIVQVYTASFTQ